MALGRLPRFSPTFSSAELVAATRNLVRPPDDAAAVRAFEAAFAEYVGVGNAVMVPSARMGLLLLLRAWGLGDGDEVVIPALTYFAVPGMVVTAGCTPVFADVGRTTFTLDPAAFEAAIGPRTRAVVPTHLFGLPADMDTILAIARKHGVRVIEDCAQGFGARSSGKRVGGLGDAAYYTFGLTKNFTTLKGAMITTDEPGVADRVRADVARCAPTPYGALWKEVLTGTAMMIAAHPAVWPLTGDPAVRIGNALGHDPIHDRFAEPERVDEVLPERAWVGAPRAAQAAVGLVQLDRVEALNRARIRNGRYLDEHLAHVPGLLRPTWPDRADPIFMSYVVRHERRDALAAALRRRGIDTTTGYMTDASTNPLFARWSRPCPEATAAHRTLLHLPVHPNLSEPDLRHLAEAVRLAAYEVV